MKKGWNVVRVANGETPTPFSESIHTAFPTQLVTVCGAVCVMSSDPLTLDREINH